jgi:hypothetical protein
MGDHPTGPLVDALMSCGIKPEDVKVEWDDLCQEDVLTFAAANIPDAVLVDLADLYLSFPSRFVFASEELDDAFQRLVSAHPRMVALRDQARRQQHEWLATRGLSGFPPFDPENESLGEFAARVEMACGAERGDLLSVNGNDALLVNPPEPSKLTPDRIQTLIALLQTRAPKLPYFVTGEDTGDVR